MERGREIKRREEFSDEGKHNMGSAMMIMMSSGDRRGNKRK